jgi:S1-C subfamily serine protease
MSRIKILAILVLGLALYSCATPVGQEYSIERKSKFVAKTHMWPKSGWKNFFTGYTFGIYKPHLFDFYAYSNVSAEDAATKSEKKCNDYRTKKGWQTKANCQLVFKRLTQLGEATKYDNIENERAELEKKKEKEKKKGSKKNKSSQGSSGSAFFISSKGDIITNNHVIEGCRSQPKVKYKNKDVTANIIATDKMLDLALLKADLRNTKYISFSKDEPKKLQRIIVAGYPFGQYISDDLKFTSGIVSSLKGPGDDSTLVQVDAALNVGNSGGPIVDESSGQLVAVAVLTMDKSVAEGQNFGIKTSSVKNFLNANKVKVPFGFNFNRDIADSLEKSTLYVYCY